MPVDHKEIAFEAAIEHHLTTAGGYVKGDRDGFAPRRAIVTAVAGITGIRAGVPG